MLGGPEIVSIYIGATDSLWWSEMFRRSPGWHMKQQNVIPCPNGTLVASCVKLQMCIAYHNMDASFSEFS